jgi:hypothetical protein
MANGIVVNDLSLAKYDFSIYQAAEKLGVDETASLAVATLHCLMLPAGFCYACQVY